jgi:hypothetical protein
MGEKCSLVSVEGETSTHISMEITEKGDLLFAGQDLGKLPQELFRDSDYEYWLRVKANDKDDVLLALIEHLYKGNMSVIVEFQAFLDKHGIKSEFFSYA